MLSKVSEATTSGCARNKGRESTCTQHRLCPRNTSVPTPSSFFLQLPCLHCGQSVHTMSSSRRGATSDGTRPHSGAGAQPQVCSTARGRRATGPRGCPSAAVVGLRPRAGLEALHRAARVWRRRGEETAQACADAAPGQRRAGGCRRGRARARLLWGRRRREDVPPPAQPEPLRVASRGDSRGAKEPGTVAPDPGSKSHQSQDAHYFMYH